MMYKKERPVKIGFYWCNRNSNVNMVKIWSYSGEPSKLFTNEDCGAPLDDMMYDNALWCGPIEPPKF